ncbi:MAG: S66 peptidase family protein [Pseudonocardiales bacterium]
MLVPVVRPAAVRPGDTVMIVSTSSPVSRDELDRLHRYFAYRGYEVRVALGVGAATGYVAGPPEQRAADLMAAFTDPDVKLIMPATGGKGAAHLLELLDFDLIRANPKVFTGMSDPSILGNAIYHRAGLVTLHGPSGYDFFQPEVNADTEAAFWQIVSGPVTGHEVRGGDWRVVRGGGQQITGHVVGGHLGTIRALIGTPWMPEVTGAVLVLEEVFVPWVAIDQALTHLRLAGVFERIAALVVGVPIDCAPDDAPDNGWDAMILRCVGGAFPVITNVEFGHTARKIPLVIGGRVTLELEPIGPLLRYFDELVMP